MIKKIFTFVLGSFCALFFVFPITADARFAATDRLDVPDSINYPAPVTPEKLAISSGLISFSSTDPSISTRLYRDGIPSQCDPPKAFPGTLPGGYRYRTFSYQNTGPGTCVTVVYNAGDCINTYYLFLAAYRGSFNPNDFSENYLGDCGSSSSGAFSFPVPVGETVVIMAQEVYGETFCSFSFSSDELSEIVSEPIPTMSEWGMILFIGLLVVSALFFLKRRSV